MVIQSGVSDYHCSLLIPSISTYLHNVSQERHDTGTIIFISILMILTCLLFKNLKITEDQDRHLTMYPDLNAIQGAVVHSHSGSSGTDSFSIPNMPASMLTMNPVM